MGAGGRVRVEEVECGRRLRKWRKIFWYRVSEKSGVVGVGWRKKLGEGWREIVEWFLKKLKRKF
jgi:hypothetical protein